jgi:hypothetical protein
MKKKRLNGTVLIMVATFMFILIVFCMATLAMVSNANKRAYNKFEENQSYYTAASALDVFADGVLRDGDIYATSRQYRAADGTSYNLTQGRALELDLYRLKVQAGTGALTSPVGLGRNGTQNIFAGSSDNTKNLEYIINADSADFFIAPASGSTLDTAETQYGQQFMSKNPTAASEVYRYASYDMELPSMSSSGSASAGAALADDDKFGLLVDKAADGTYPVALTVEVIERYYDLYGIDQKSIKAYMEAVLSNSTISDTLAAKVSGILGPYDSTDTGVNAYIPGDDDTYKNVSLMKIKSLMQKGSRTKDYMKIKVTAEASLLGIKSQAVRVFDITPPLPTMNENALTNLGYNQNGAQFVSIGGSASLVATNLKSAGNAGPMFSTGTFEFHTPGGTRQIAEDGMFNFVDLDGYTLTPYITSLDWFTWRNIPDVEYQGFNTLYYGLSGFYFPTNGGTIGTSSNAVHMVSPGDLLLNNPLTIYGNLVIDEVTMTGGGSECVKVRPVSDSSGSSRYGAIYMDNLKEMFGGIGNNHLSAKNQLDLDWNDNGTLEPTEGWVYANNITLDLTLAQLQALSSPTWADAPNYIKIPKNVKFSGKIYTRDGQEVTLTGSSDLTGYNQLKSASSILKAYFPIDVTYDPSITPAEVHYFADSDGDGDGDYVFLENFKKQFTLPYGLYLRDGTDCNPGTGKGKFLLDTPRSQYGKFFSEKTVWGSGFAVDTNNDGYYDALDVDGDSFLDNGDTDNDGVIDGGDGMIVGYKDSLGIIRRVHYGILTGPSGTSGGFTYANKNYFTSGIDTQSVTDGAAYIGLGYDKEDILKCVKSGAEFLKETFEIGDGLTTDVYPSNQLATVDATAGSYNIGSTTVTYKGTISGNGIIPSSCFIERNVGSNVYIVDTSSGDVNLQFPLISDGSKYISNIGLIVKGSGRVTLIVPPSPTASQSKFVMGADGKQSPFFCLTEELFLMNGLTINNGIYQGNVSSNRNNLSAISTGNHVDVSLRTPGSNITLVVGENMDIYFSENSALAGMVYVPDGNFQLYPTPALTQNYSFNGDLITGVESQVMGSVICGSFTTTNDTAVSYLSPGGKRDDGTPTFDWKSGLYLPS